MTQEQYIQMVVASTIGIVLQLLFKAYRLRKKARESNQKFLFVDWVKHDVIILLLNIISPYVVVYLIDEWIFDGEAIDEKWASKLKTIFVFVGFTGSSILMGFFSQADKRLSKIIDTKTNLADYGQETKPQ